MPELPEVQTVVNELNRKLKNRAIKRVAVRTAKLISIGPQTVSNLRDVNQKIVNKFVNLLRGKKILAVRRRGKMIIIDFDQDLHLLVHLKMTGQFIFEDTLQAKKTGSKYRLVNNFKFPEVKLPYKHTHVVFYFDDGAVLYYNDVRQFGYLRLVASDELDQVTEFMQWGVEPLSQRFTYQYFLRSLKSRKQRAIKLALMDPAIVAGIGNIYSDEILFHSKIRPNRKVGSLIEKELRAIFAHIKPVLKLGVKHKGSSVGDFIRTNGKWGKMGNFHFVYGRKGQPCLNCDTILVNIKLGGRTSCFCPKEQQ